MSEHTPGPWEVCGHFIRTARSNSPGLEVARVDFTASHFDAATREANGHVLAAAPELLEALELAISIESGFSCPVPVFKQMQAAIAKARGTP